MRGARVLKCGFEEYAPFVWLLAERYQRCGYAFVPLATEDSVHENKSALLEVEHGDICGIQTMEQGQLSVLALLGNETVLKPAKVAISLRTWKFSTLLDWCDTAAVRW